MSIFIYVCITMFAFLMCVNVCFLCCSVRFLKLVKISAKKSCKDIL